MRSPLAYLTAVKLKNQLRALLKSPAKLIYGVFLVAVLVLSRLGGGDAAGAARPLADLRALLAVFYTAMFLLLAAGAGGRGNSAMFTLSDVNLLFPSPLSPAKILFYGVLRQLGVSLLLGVFLLFQYGWLHSAFGVGYGGLLLIVAGYALTLFAAQVCNMLVYARSGGRDDAARWVRRGIAALGLLFAGGAAWSCRGAVAAMIAAGEPDLPALLAGLSAYFGGPLGALFPFSGWIAGACGGLLAGEPLPALLLLALTAAGLGAVLLVIVRSKNNYYEDALEAAETAQSTVTAGQEGQVAEITRKRTRLGKTGLGRGWGASAIYYKHRVENRRSGVFFLSGPALLFGAVILGFTLLLRAIEGEEFSGGAGLLAAFAMGTYLQFFSVALGRFNRELLKPAIYLIPEPPLKKLLYALLESLVAEAAEAVVIFVPVALIVGAGPVDAALCILARISFSYLFTAGNVVVERVFGTVSSRALVFLFYFLVLVLLAAPGVALGAVLVALDALPGFAGLFLGVIACNLPLGTLALFFCRNLLGSRY